MSTEPRKVRNEYEQLEYQRKNPQLFTTMSQCVNADGSLTTYEQITHKLKKTLDRSQEAHSRRFGGEHPTYCMRPVVGAAEHDICKIIELCEEDMNKCRETFVRNYRHYAQLSTNKRKG